MNCHAEPAEAQHKFTSVQHNYFVYILRCADGTLYTGCTNDLARRLRAHGNQKVKYTRCRLPVALAYFEAAADRSAALRREAAIKRLARRTKLALCGCAKLC